MVVGRADAHALTRLWVWLACAISFLTILPVSRRLAPDLEDIRRSTFFYPLIGVLLGLVASGCAVLLAAVLRVPAGPAAVVVLTLQTALTGALHVDGWMDLADGLASRKPAAEALAVMRDSRVGAVGAAAGALLLLGKWSAIAAVLSGTGAGGGVAWRVAAACAVLGTSRWAMVLAMRLAPYARPIGGLGAAFARAVPGWCLLGAVWPGLALALAVWVAPSPAHARVLTFTGMLAVGGVIGSVGFTGWMRRRFGGMTGDLYGALGEAIEWFGWLALCACSR